jgi:pilus assembly protein Flp/PilA
MIQLFSFVQAWFASRGSDERGATMVEYGLMVGLIATVCLAIVGVLGGQISTLFNSISNQL